MSDCSCSCTCSAGPLLVLPCAGGSNVGQISNAAAVEMDKQEKAKIYCLIGVAAHITGMVDATKSASSVIAIDGCPVACAKEALDHIGIPISQHIIVTDLGIEKNHVFEWSDEQIEKVIASVTVKMPVK